MQWVLAVAAVGVFAAVVGLVLWLVLGQNRTGQVAAPPSPTATEAPTTQAKSTSQSVFVVCRAGPGEFYYRGIRLSDGAGIELANVVRSSGGFDVTNPTDGARYQIRPDGLTIVPPDGQAITEPMVQYATS